MIEKLGENLVLLGQLLGLPVEVFNAFATAEGSGVGKEQC